MTQYIRARFSRATRLGVAILTTVILALMSGDRPAGQIATLPNAIDFLGTTAAAQYVTFGQATGPNGLSATDFTVEFWFKKEGAPGQTTTTSGATGGGLSGAAVPLVAKGRGEADMASNVDINYFVGLNQTGTSPNFSYFLAADFEEGAGQTSPSQNHAIISATPIVDNTWYHAAATYNATTGEFILYLNGAANTTLAVGPNRAPRSDSIQHASIGTALNSTGVAAGFFNGVIDEVRIWNVVRTPAQIASNMSLEVGSSETGLLGRWGFNEGAGNLAFNSVPGGLHGTVMGTTAPTRVAGGIPADVAAPPAPQNVAAHVGNGVVTISWPDNSALDLSGYNVYRNGSATPLNVGVLTRAIFTDNTVTNGTPYSYTVRAVDTSSNLSPLSTPVIATPNAFTGAGMQFNGTNQYVTFGQSAGTSTGLGAQTFTLETWFKRTGFGAVTSTGTGGTLPGVTNVIPLISKGMAEAETPVEANMNYFLGISAASGRLVADFEDTVNGGNHPITGNTPIPISTTEWHHAAATYDGTTWRLYLDGNPDGTLVVGSFIPESLSTQHAAIGTALTRAGTQGSPAGYFAGLMDEVRIWNVARSQADIQQTMFQEINPTDPAITSLIGYWKLNEASGPTAASSTRNIPGTLMNTPTWTAGYPYPGYTTPPAAPQDLVADPGNARVSLTWTPNAEPVGYNVYRSTSSPVSLAGPPLNGSTPLTLPNYLNLGLTNGTPYFYVVTAVNSFGTQSSPSNEANATPLASLNQTPIVTAGPDREIDFAGVATLSGAATDDGPFTATWTKISGPATVTFGNPNSAATTATLTEPGTYVLRLTADDGAKSAFDEMTVTVNFVLTGAGDVAPNCTVGDSIANAQATATLLDGMPGPLFTLGDNSYVDGTAQQFASCYEPTWGRHKARTRPVTGNHDYNTPGATGYYNYFNGPLPGGQNGPAGDRTLGGYYSYNVGNWHVVVLNSECSASPELWDQNGCDAGSAQEQWLRTDLANSPTNNIIAMWHRPRYSSSSDDAAHAYTQPLWQALYDYGADIYLGGHWHNYERLDPMNALGQPDDNFGIRTFVVGTAGVPVSGAFPNQRSTSQVRNSTAHGLMKLTLKDDSYDWQFVQIPGEQPAFTDSGSAGVHGAPGSQPPVVNAGPDQTIGAGATELAGSVTDDSPNTATWSQVSGPAAAAFGNANSAVTSVGFTTAGTYVLQLTVNDGKYVRSDTVSITVTSATGNLPPMVNVGADLFVTLPNHASLTATLNDDGFTGIDVSPTWTNQTPAVGTVTFDDPNTTTTTAAFSAPGTYVLRLTATDGEISGFDELTVTVSPVEPNNAVQFPGSSGSAYVTFGAAPALGVSAFTIEAWFKRTGQGVGTSTGSLGFDGTPTGNNALAIPLVTKGRAQSDGSNVDMNFFLGINDTTGALLADFEDSNSTPTSGVNHPVTGVTAIPINATTWHHAAATYDGTTWRLYLDGALDKEEFEGNFTPRFDSIQHAAIGSALTSAPAASGFFEGVIDEVRIWNRALSLSEIQANINQPLPSGPPDLVARWGLNETGTTTTVLDSTPSPVNGTINGSGWTRVAGAPFNLVFNQAPNMPVLNTPTNGATGQTTSPTLSVNVSDPDPADLLSVSFFGRATNGAPAADFNIVAIPDTQHYVDDLIPNDADGNRALTFTQQTQWIVNNRAPMNIVWVSHLGDIVEHIDTNTPNTNPPINAPLEWQRADASMQVLDNALMPYGIAPGNHDENSAGVANGYDQYFGLSRMSGYPWYGGYLGQNQFNFTDPINRLNKNQYSLFTEGGMDFIVIHLEYDMPTYAVAWADRVLKAYPNRRAIIATHLFLSDSGSRPTTVLNRTTDGTPAATVWNNLIVPNCNVFLILNGHYPGEANRTDATPTNAACPGRAVHQLESDYQSRINGGDGWLRYMTFKPSENKIYVYTYSPKLGQFETDANSQFVLDYNMQGVAFTQIATNNNVTSGTDTQTTWSGRTGNTQYQWYATVSDGNQTVTGPTWSFTTAAPANNPPVAGDSTSSTNEDTTVTVSQATLIANDTDPEGSPLVVISALNATNGTAVHNANGSITFTPAANFNGTAGFDYTVSDGTLTDIGHVTVNVSAVNDAPVAFDDTASTNEDTAVIVTQATMVSNDTDAEGSTRTVTAVSNPTNGTAVRNATTGAITFTPAANFSGTGGFDYTVSDGALTDIGHVTVTVTPVNDPVVAVDDTTSTPEDTQVTRTQAQLVANDTNPDGNTLTVTAASNATNGAAVRNADGSVTFTPTANFSGTAGYDYTVSDGTVTDIGHVTVTVTAVNDAPVAFDDTASTNEDTAVIVTQATMVANDTDVEGSTRTVTAVSNPTNGTAVRNATTGAITFTPAANFSGTGGFDYTVSDGTLTDIGHVTVTVNPVNDPPLAGDDTTSTQEDTAETRTQANLVGNDTDPDGNTLAVTAASNPTNGTVVRNADGSVTFTPTANFSGTAGYDYTVSDGTLTDIGHVTVNVTAVNDAPVAFDDTASTAMNTALNLTQANLKGNDTDPDNTNAQLTVTAVNNPTNGTVQLVSGTVTFTPTTGYTGPAGFDYTISDGTLTDVGHVTVTVSNGPNVAPVAGDDSTSTPEDTAVTITQVLLTANDNDANGNPLTVTAVSSPTNGTAVRNADGSVTFTPAANFNGTAGYDYTVSDGLLTDIGHVTVNVSPVNDPPVANGQSVSTIQGIPIGITLTGSDPDGGVPNFAVQTQPTNGILSGTAPNLTYTPTAGYVGGDSFTFRTSDASTPSAPATVSITVNLAAPFTALGVGTHFPTVDNADGPGPGPRAVTPPAVQLGDMVVIVAAYGGTATLTMSETGGQAWTAEANTQANGQTVRVFWAQFNGTWSANPSVTNTTGTGPLTVYSFAIDLAPGTYPEIDVPFGTGNHSGGTVTVPSFSTNTPGALALVGWISADNNTWGTPTTGWSSPGGQTQWRNNSSVDNSIALAYRNIASAGTTGSIARTQTNGPDAGLYFRMAFKATTLTPATPPGDPANLEATASLGQVALTWQDNASNEFAFQIERCANAGCTNFAPLTGVGSNVTSYNDTTVAGTTTYKYRVRASNVIGSSQYAISPEVTTPTPAFTFRSVGTHFPTVENADQGGGPGPRAIVPPAAQLGDLVVIVAAYRGTATLTMTETGGQVWTAETNAQANGVTTRVFWSQFNGAWTGNPAVTNTTGTSPLTVYGFAFDMAPGLYPDIDVPFVSGGHSGGTVTVPSFTTNTVGVLGLAGFISIDNNTWSAPTVGWSTPGGQAQWRNSNGSDNTIALAYRLLGPVGPSGNIVRTQSASGPDAGLYFRMAFRAFAVPSDPPADPSDLVATPSIGQVALTWIDHASNEAGFNIERCAGVACTNFATIGVAGPNAASYNDITVLGTTTYRYQVRAYNLFSPSNPSNIADALTPATPPPPPIPFTFRSVGTHFPTVDNTNGTGPGPGAVTPPGSLQAGDLYVIVASYRGTATLSLSNTGGQTWTSEANTQANGVTARVFWTRFNGTWAGNPSVTNTAGTEALTVYNFAFAMSAGTHPEMDVALLSAGHSGGTVTVPSFTTNTAGTLALVGFLSNENNSWSAPTAGWSVPGGQQQWRNTTGEDTSLAFAYRVITSIGATGNIVRSQTDGPDPGLYFRLAWKMVQD